MTSGKNHHWQRYGLWYALGFFVATRVLVHLVASWAFQAHPPSDQTTALTGAPMLRWDGGHYSYILQAGYPRENGGLPAPPRSDTVAFFPLYPVMARPLAWWLGPELSLVVFTQLASALAVVLLYLWARLRCGARVAFWCAVALCSYPPAMFFSTAYADGLLVLWTAMALWLMEHRRVWLTAVVCGLASATRPNGLALSAVFILWVLMQRPWPPWPRQAARIVALGLVSVSGLIVFQLHLWQHYGRPDAFSAVQANWGTPHPPRDPILRIVTLKPVLQPALRPLKYAFRGDLANLSSPLTWNAFWNVMLWGLGIAGLIRPGPIPRPFFLIPILVCLMAWLPDPYRGDRLVGIARYQLMSLPCFLLLAAWMSTRWPAWARAAFCAAWLVLQGLYAHNFVTCSYTIS